VEEKQLWSEADMVQALALPFISSETLGEPWFSYL
jgi:hypothetical protein